MNDFLACFICGSCLCVCGGGWNLSFVRKFMAPQYQIVVRGPDALPAFSEAIPLCSLFVPLVSTDVLLSKAWNVLLLEVACSNSPVQPLEVRGSVGAKDLVLLSAEFHEDLANSKFVNRCRGHSNESDVSGDEKRISDGSDDAIQVRD